MMNSAQMSGTPIISVGLIVKNEEARLEKCLAAIKRVLDEVPGEIVVVDTGSTDGTVEIAKKYTDKVYDFEWIDDFAAARNFGLSKCSGEWFMYLDADEVLDEDVTPLVEFLKSEVKGVTGAETADEKTAGKEAGELNKRAFANSARLVLKNYADSNCEVYTESRNLRLVRMSCRIPCEGEMLAPCFKGAIHEGLPVIQPCAGVEQIVHHYGYIADGDKDPVEAMREKHRRNMPALLKLYEQDRTSPRTLAHLYYSCEPEEKERYLTEWYGLLNLPYRDEYSLPVYVALIQILNDGGCYEDALYYAEEYLKSYGDDSVTTLSVLALTVCALSSAGQSELAVDFFKSYDQIYRLFKSNQIPTDELNTCVVFFGTSETDYIGLILLYISELLKTGDKKEAKAMIESLEGVTMPKILADAAQQIKDSLAD